VSISNSAGPNTETESERERERERETDRQREKSGKEECGNKERKKKESMKETECVGYIAKNWIPVEGKTGRKKYSSLRR
jgi:hypothetical protein